jgi:hypothetical protein
MGARQPRQARPVPRPLALTPGDAARPQPRPCDHGARTAVLLPIEDIVQNLNRYLRGWAGYFRYGNSARHFNLIEHHAHNRLALFVAKRHQRTRAYGCRTAWA